MLTIEKLEKMIEDNKAELSAKKEKAKKELKATYDKVTKKHREREQAKEDLDATKYAKLDQELTSLKNTVEMLEEQIKKIDKDINTPTNFLDAEEIKELHEQTEQAQFNLLPELRETVTKLNEIIEKSRKLTADYEKIAKLFYGNDGVFRNSYEFRGFDLIGMNITPLITRIEVGEEKANSEKIR